MASTTDRADEAADEAAADTRPNTRNDMTDSVFHDDDSSTGPPELSPDNISDGILTKAPEERFRLGYWSVIALVVNRVIGTGIFNSPSTVMRGTRSVGITLLFWLAGATYTIAGAYLNIEFGLSTPRYEFEGIIQGIPRSGGTLNYLQYVYKWPSYRPETVLLISCIYATAYIILGNMAGNCLIFGIRILQACNVPQDPNTVRGIAVAVATFACGIHAFSRRGGIWLGNLFALIKVLLLLMMIVTGICAWAGTFKTKNYVSDNMALDHSFADPAQDSYGYAKAFLAVLFAWSGFDQPNYVLSEIGRPRKKFPIGTSIGVALVVFLYIFVNLAYMVVVRKEDQLDPKNNVALLFFTYTFGAISTDGTLPQRILSAFMAISSFGNIVVMTFTASRLKQEIAKEGFLPFAKFFVRSRDLSLGRFLAWIQKNPHSFINRKFHWLLGQRWLSPQEHSQQTPFGALSLHWLFTVLMIAATAGLAPQDAYGVLVDLYSYTIVAVFGFAIAVGMLKLRFSSRENWRQKSSFNPWFSILSAIIFGIGSLYPIVAIWVPPNGDFASQTTLVVSWFTTPTAAWSILAFGMVWYFGFRLYASRRARKDGVEFQVQKVPHFDKDPPPDGPPIQIHEKVYLAWVAKECTPPIHMRNLSSRESF